MSDMQTGCRTCGTHWQDVELLADNRCAVCLLADIERLHSGIAEVERFVASNEAWIDFDRHSNQWYVFTNGNRCNDDRHADTLLELVKILGAAKAAGGDDDTICRPPRD